jgi:hypothetical protein
MIRREPTMIPMSDSDVQDVRDLVTSQNTDMQLLNHTKIMAERPLTDDDVPLLLQAALQEKNRLERERRLGLEPGQTFGTDASISAHPHPHPGPSASNPGGKSANKYTELRVLILVTLQVPRD